ncbi:MAG: DUF2125 domain-containing protein [Alphaproteobacteria bacterium]|nr:DUF2125 domain-containing protein [Alphaproteobacteria bacterium]
MARSSDKTAAKPRRRFVWLAVFIVALVAAYTGAWFYLARQLESRSAFLISDLANQNVDADCESMEVRGYPFRLGVFCQSVSADDRLRSASLSTGSFRSAAQIYRPSHIVSELDSPVRISMGDGSTAQLDWQTLQSSTVFGLSGLTRASLQSSMLDATIAPAAISDPVKLTARSTEMHVRQQDSDLDAVLRLDAAALTTQAKAFALPAFDLEADLTLADRAWMLSEQQNPEQNPLRNLSASLNGLKADVGDGAEASVEGPFSIDGEGYLTGKFTVELRGREAWQTFLTTAFPADAQNIRNAAGFLTSLGKSQDSLTIPLNIERGRIMIGFITLGQLPPL